MATPEERETVLIEVISYLLGHRVTDGLKLDRILVQLNEMRQHMTATQDKLDAIAGQVGAVRDSITAGVTEILAATDGVRGDIQALKEQVGTGQEPDFTAVDASLDELSQATAGLSSAADSLAALDAENPASTPGPAPEPTPAEPTE